MTQGDRKQESEGDPSGAIPLVIPVTEEEWEKRCFGVSSPWLISPSQTFRLCRGKFSTNMVEQCMGALKAMYAWHTKSGAVGEPISPADQMRIA